MKEETPRTDALLQERRHQDASDWNTDDVTAFLQHARALERELRQVSSALDCERRNHPFYKELCGDFEKALGPHHKYDNGCWIKRIEELREFKERNTL